MAQAKPPQSNHFTETLLQLTNSKVKLQFVPERSGDIKHSYANISKASELLGYKPEFSLTEGLKACLDENALLISKK